MLALTVLGLLALAPADTVVRVPGTALRFGLADTLVAARGFAPAADGAREGRCRFFGMDGAARLRFVDGRLARAEFTVERASPRQRDYVQDQLAAMGYRRSCAKLLPAASDCEWTGRTRVHLTVTGARLEAVVTPRAAAGPTAADTLPAAPDTVAVAPVPAPPETAAAPPD